MHNRQIQLGVKPYQRDGQRHRLIFASLILLTGLIVAGHVDAAVHQPSEQNQVNGQQQVEPFFQQMLKYALVVYAKGYREEAYDRLLPLAQQNVVDAQYYLASLYDDERNVIASPAMAAHWYQRAAKLGHVSAQYNIGVAYANGYGVQQSIVDAVRWWRMAAIAGSINAQFNLGIMYLRGEGIRHDPVEAVRWWGKAAEQGDPAAQYNLGALYANGQGVSQNIETAVSWWVRAAAQGFEQAIVALQDERLSQPVKLSIK